MERARYISTGKLMKELKKHLEQSDPQGGMHIVEAVQVVASYIVKFPRVWPLIKRILDRQLKSKS